MRLHPFTRRGRARSPQARGIASRHSPPGPLSARLTLCQSLLELRSRLRASQHLFSTFHRHNRRFHGEDSAESCARRTTAFNKFERSARQHARETFRILAEAWSREGAPPRPDGEAGRAAGVKRSMRVAVIRPIAARVIALQVAARRAIARGKRGECRGERVCTRPRTAAIRIGRRLPCPATRQQRIGRRLRGSVRTAARRRSQQVASCAA